MVEISLPTESSIPANLLAVDQLDIEALGRAIGTASKISQELKPGREHLRIHGWCLRSSITPVPAVNTFIGLKDDSTIVVSLPDSIETLTLLKTVKIEGAAPEPGQRLGSLIILAAIIEIFYRNTPSDSIIHNKTVSTIHSLVGSSTGKAQYSIALVLFQHILGKSIRRGQGAAGERPWLDFSWVQFLEWLT